MTWLALIFALEAGIVTDNAWMIHESYTASEYPTAYTQFEAEIVALDTFFFRALLRTDVVELYGIGWDPRVSGYDNTFGVQVGPIEIGLRHVCIHPMETYIGMMGDRGGRVVEGSFEEVYIRFESDRRF